MKRIQRKGYRKGFLYPEGFGTITTTKIRRRIEAGLCVGCGKAKCGCKRVSSGALYRGRELRGID